MKHLAMNPYLPLYEYIPDGEPRIFGDRLYVYGSHDEAGGRYGFCAGDYMVWSAPLDDLGDWRCDGVAYRRSDCPDGLLPGEGMAAPDVVCGADGRYYLYYNAKTNICHIAVSDVPEGPFRPYGDVSNPDGTPYDAIKMFDPGVLVDDDGRVYLFTGFCMPGPVPEAFKVPGAIFPETSLGYELASDMKTILKGPNEILPGANVSEGTGFEGHGFYEASSPRKINGSYVMVYSDEQSHALSYALADKPFGPYRFADVLISNADIGINGNTEPVMPHGNTHGGLVRLNGDWYVFHHRHTSGQEASRQGVAEKLPIREDGWFGQAQITSCGLNQGPLPAEGEYNACYCCYLTSPSIQKTRYTVRECRRDSEPHIYEEAAGTNEKEYLHYIANIETGTVVGYKFFDFAKPVVLFLRLRGTGKVGVSVSLDSPDEKTVCESFCELSDEWKLLNLDMTDIHGTHALYLRFQTEQTAQFERLIFA